MSRPPDVFLVVADCLRSFGSLASTNFPATRELSLALGGSAIFTRCVSAAPWTIPSHASLLTGLYPWQHNAHARADQTLNSTFQTLPAVLRSSGYRTLCLSANPVLNSKSGLLRDFDVAETAEWWELYARRASYYAHSSQGSGVRRGSVRRSLHQPSPDLSRAIQVALEAVHRLPALLDLGERVYQKMDGAQAWDPTVCPWIENRLSEVLSATPSQMPVFALINLMDAHEPYLTSEQSTPLSRDWWRLLTTPQRSSVYAQGRRTPSAAERRTLELLYTEATSRLEIRVAKLVELLKKADRWDNSLFLLTSDHGQALLEHGLLFHGYKIYEPLVRVPLVVRFPQSLAAGTRCDHWASSVDILPTVERTIGLAPQTGRAGKPLDLLLKSERLEPVFTVGDGMLSHSNVSDWRTQSMRARLDVMAVGAYKGPYKLIVEENVRTPRVFDVQLDPLETTDVWSPKRAEFIDQLRAAETVRDSLILYRTSSPLRGDQATARLHGWGYV